MTEGSAPLSDRLIAALADRYTLDRELGAGGMATVYLARDVRHDRDVAIKVLKPELAAVIGGERFITEIRTTANLQHPHILPLFDSGESDGFLYYVMPFVDGESLRDKLDRERQLGVDESIRIAKAVASALEYAHGQGVIHRDIKPENILLHAGQPVVADFGIALALSAAGGGRMTETGLSLGTPHYMSPEQATADRDLSARSDVYSLACVLYEMLAGDPPHTGPTAQAILMRILTDTPRSVTEVRTAVPPHISAVLSKALEKLPADRFESAEAFSKALDDAGFSYAARTRAGLTPAGVGGGPGAQGGSGALPAGAWLRDRRSIAVIAVAGIAGLFAVAGGWQGTSEPGPGAPPFRVALDAGDFQASPFQFIDIAEDGSRIAVNRLPEGTTMVGAAGYGSVWVRDAGEEGFREVPGTDEAMFFDLSPDGEWLLFTRQEDSTMVRVPVNGGSPGRVLDQPGIFPLYPEWGKDGTIVFTTSEAIYQVQENGEGLTLLADSLGGIESGSAPVISPFLLPDAKGVLFARFALEGAVISPGQVIPSSISLLDLSDGSVREIIAEGTSPRYVETGHIVYGHPAGGLFAIAFDLDRMQTEGSPIHLRDGVRVDILGAHFDVSPTGVLVYGSGGTSFFSGTRTGTRHRLLFSSAGGSLDTVRLAPRNFQTPRISPDGRYLAVAVSESPVVTNIHHFDLLDGSPRQLTFEGQNRTPVWSPEGARIAYSSNQGDSDVVDLFVQPVDGGAPAERLLERPGVQTPVAWPNDSTLVFEDLDLEQGGSTDLFIVDPRGGAEPVPYLRAEHRERALAVSPDGTLAAYESNEEGTNRIYIRRFPVPEGQWVMSTAQGAAPRWSPSGSTLYYWTTSAAPGADTLFAVRLETDPVPRKISTEVVVTGDYSTSWDVHPDGTRFLLREQLPLEGADAEPGTPAESERFFVVTNWFDELRAIVGVGGG